MQEYKNGTKVIDIVNQNTITIEQLTKDKIDSSYVLFTSRAKYVSFLTQTDYQSGRYHVMCLDALTIGNNHAYEATLNITDPVKVIASYLKSGFEVTLFNTAIDFVNALAEAVKKQNNK